MKHTPRNSLALSARPAALAAWAAMAVFATMTAIGLVGGSPQPFVGASAQPLISQNANELSPADRGLYALIDEAQAHADYAAADRLMLQLTNRLLLGYKLADRYLEPSYKTSDAELTDWLSAYGDHPQASRIASLALRHGLPVNVTKAEPLRGEGYSDHEGRNAMPDRWFSGLTHWRNGDYAEAETLFAQTSADDTLSDWQRAEVWYWTYRAQAKLRNDREAHDALEHSAHYPTTFYGLIANEQLGNPPLQAKAPEVTDRLRNDPRVIRAALLTQLDDTNAAEDELRALYGAIPAHERGGIVTLASELGLSNLQMRLARTPALSEAEQLFAQFPIPPYMSRLQPVMDSALLMSVARNESGFRELARNPSGALGMMQMLPTTAQAVERRVGEKFLTTADAGNSDMPLAERLSDPALSARYGAEYLKLLSNTPAINHNLIHLLVGYNAGPGTVIGWKAAAHNVNDPLLYIESMPYAETRNYVMQVAAQYWIYQRRLDEKPESLTAIARGAWPMMPAKAL